MKPKIRIIAAGDNFNFISNLISPLSSCFDIQPAIINNIVDKNEINLVFKDFESSDLVWLEWADGWSIGLLDYIRKPKIILRVHRYELFSERTLSNLNALKQDSINRINKVVFVSKVVQQIGIDKFPWMQNSVVIPNLIDSTKFPLCEKEPGFNIMMLGRMSYVKNIPLAFSMFYELWEIDSRYKLHIVGNISDLELVYYCSNFIDKTGLDKNIIFHGRIENDKLPEFMKDMHYILCASIFESQGMGILEAMACGLKPLVFDFPGAEYIFPIQNLWIDFEQLKTKIIGNYEPIKYYNFAYNNYSIEKNIHLYVNMINEVLGNGKDLSIQGTKDEGEM